MRDAFRPGAGDRGFHPAAHRPDRARPQSGCGSCPASQGDARRPGREAALRAKANRWEPEAAGAGRGWNFRGRERAARLADLQDQIRAGENRLCQIAVELAGLGDGAIDEAEVAGALGRFAELVGGLTTPEKVRLLQLLVQKVVYDRARETVAITFHPSGFEAILEEITI